MYLLNGEQKIVEVDGHYEIQTMDGKFISSGATWDECYDDLKKMIIDEIRVTSPMAV